MESGGRGTTTDDPPFCLVEDLTGVGRTPSLNFGWDRRRNVVRTPGHSPTPKLYLVGGRVWDLFDYRCLRVGPRWGRVWSRRVGYLRRLGRRDVNLLSCLLSRRSGPGWDPKQILRLDSFRTTSGHRTYRLSFRNRRTCRGQGFPATDRSGQPQDHSVTASLHSGPSVSVLRWQEGSRDGARRHRSRTKSGPGEKDRRRAGGGPNATIKSWD